MKTEFIFDAIDKLHDKHRVREMAEMFDDLPAKEKGDYIAHMVNSDRKGMIPIFMMLYYGEMGTKELGKASTNDDRPFEIGEQISWGLDARGYVVENKGSMGLVNQIDDDDGDKYVAEWEWDWEDIKCVRGWPDD